MSRLKSSYHNIGHHAVSGLSKLLPAAYETCQASGIWICDINLLSCNIESEGLKPRKSLYIAIYETQEKVREILTSTANINFEEIVIAKIYIDFNPDESLHNERKKEIEISSGWYSPSTIYRYRVRVTFQKRNADVYEEIFEAP